MQSPMLLADGVGDPADVQQQQQQHHHQPGAGGGAANDADGIARGYPEGLVDNNGWAYYVFHPYGRLCTAVSLTICNFMLYGEDPVVHAYTEAEVPIAGQAYSLAVLRWPDHGGVIVAKVAFSLLALVLGLIIGRVVVHDMLLRDIFKLKLCGWEYYDLDDIRTSTPYNPFKKDTPYNRMWWGGHDIDKLLDKTGGVPDEYKAKPRDTTETEEQKARVREAYAKGYERGVVSVSKPMYEFEAIFTGERASKKWYEEDPPQYQYSRADYEAEHETALEMWCPSLFRPRKHCDHSKGSCLVMGATAAIVMALVAMFYNEAIIAAVYGKEDQKRYRATVGIGMNEHVFGKFAACFCWLADLLNLATAADSTFQEIGKHQAAIRANYKGAGDPLDHLKTLAYKRPKIVARYDEDADLRQLAKCVEHASPRMKLGYVALAPGFSKFWNKPVCQVAGCLVEIRILVVWIIGLTLTLLIFLSIELDVARWDDFSEKYGFGLYSTELSRLILATSIAIQGPLTIIQDLEWPSFDGTNDIDIPGFQDDHISCKCCNVDSGGRTNVPFTRFFVTNKWITFIPFVMSLGLDYAMLWACYEYHPALYGQYVNPENQTICVINNETLATAVKEAWEADKTILVNYTDRLEGGFLDETLDGGDMDFCLPARFTGIGNAAKFWAALPGILMYVFFIIYLVRWSRLSMIVRKQEGGDATAAGDKPEHEYVESVRMRSMSQRSKRDGEGTPSSYKAPTLGVGGDGEGPATGAALAGARAREHEKDRERPAATLSDGLDVTITSAAGGQVLAHPQQPQPHAARGVGDPRGATFSLLENSRPLSEHSHDNNSTELGPSPLLGAGGDLGPGPALLTGPLRNLSGSPADVLMQPLAPPGGMANPHGQKHVI